MKEKYTNNSIEQTFRKAFDQVKTKPSEKFWTDVSNTILERTNKLYNRRVRIWKMTSFSLAVMLLCLVFYTFYRGNSINSNQNQTKLLEKQQVLNRPKDKSVEKNPALNTKDNPNIPYNNSPNSSDISLNKSNSPKLKKTHLSNGDKDSDELSAKTSTKTTEQVGINNSGIVIKENERNGSLSSDIFTNGNSATIKSLSSPETIASNKATLSDSTRSNFNKKDSALFSQPEPIVSKSVLDSSSFATNFSKKDTANSFLAKTLTPVSNPGSRASRFSIGLFIAPSLGGEFKQVNDAYGNSVGVVSKENARVVFDAGINIDYSISNKWILRSGLGYHAYSFSIEASSITAQQNAQGILGYSLITSSGILQLPYYDARIQALDSIKVHGNAYFRYLSIPLQIKYNFTTEKHCGIYVTGGIVTNFLLVKGAFVHRESETDRDDESIHDIDGLNNTQLLYTAGAGLNYKVGKGFSICGEPFLTGSITSIDKNTPEISYPFSAGLRVGLFYKF